jgi:cytosine/uracil/thiamine/allantoin permease
LILIGILLIVWGYQQADNFSRVLDQSRQLSIPAAVGERSGNVNTVTIQPITDVDGKNKATEYRLGNEKESMSNEWSALPLQGNIKIETEASYIQLRRSVNGEALITSSVQQVQNTPAASEPSWWNYLLWFTAMVGFWATMSISISDITRFARSQKDQVAGQFIGLPGTMLFYSFVGIFVTSAAVIGFNNVLISEDAPWDPVNLVSMFNQKYLVLFAQLALVMATLSTNIAANVIAPAYAISNLYPSKISFRMGGVIAGLAGIALCPWLLLDSIGGILIFISGLLGPVVGIMLCDYFLIRKRELNINALYRNAGEYSYGRSGINFKAVIALLAGILTALAGRWVPALEFLFTLSWFTGFITAFFVYRALMKPKEEKKENKEIDIDQPQLMAT